MLGKPFGKRVSGAPTSGAAHGYAPARPNPDGETRIFPQAVWDGPHGEKLRQLGFSPDDPANLALTPDRARAMEDAATARMNGLVAKVNAHVPGVSVLPWAMIPWAVWKGPNAEFLIKLDFLPSSPWNTMLLPADAKSSAFLGLPHHPRVAQPGLDENLTRLIDQLRIESRDEIERNLAAISSGDFSVLERYEKSKKDRFQKLFALARHVASTVFGEAACAQHDKLFGIGLTGVPG